MLVDLGRYRRNSKTGSILNRERVIVRCDHCGKEQSCAYGDFKRVNQPLNLCLACRNRTGVCGVKGKQRPRATRVYKKCPYCHKDFLTYPTQSETCSRECAAKFRIKKVYGAALNTFDSHLDEWSYVAGVILGDGTLSKVERKYTTNVSIFSNSNEPQLLCTVQEILWSLGVKSGIYKNGLKRNCIVIQFALPDALLSRLGILFCGDKFKNMPPVSGPCLGNPNFALGLINSDGYYLRRTVHGKGRCLSFSSTVPNIMAAFVQCLDVNSVGHTEPAIYQNKFGWRDKHCIQIAKESEIAKLLGVCAFPIKQIHFVR